MWAHGKAKKQNKKTSAFRLVQWVGWVFETEKERKNISCV